MPATKKTNEQNAEQNTQETTSNEPDAQKDTSTEPNVTKLIERIGTHGEMPPAGYTFNPTKNPPVFKTEDADRVESVKLATGAGGGSAETE